MNDELASLIVDGEFILSQQVPAYNVTRAEMKQWEADVTRHGIYAMTGAVLFAFGAMAGSVNLPPWLVLVGTAVGLPMAVGHALGLVASWYTPKIWQLLEQKRLVGVATPKGIAPRRVRRTRDGDEFEDLVWEAKTVGRFTFEAHDMIVWGSPGMDKFTRDLVVASFPQVRKDNKNRGDSYPELIEDMLAHDPPILFDNGNRKDWTRFGNVWRGRRADNQPGQTSA